MMQEGLRYSTFARPHYDICRYKFFGQRGSPEIIKQSLGAANCGPTRDDGR